MGKELRLTALSGILAWGVNQSHRRISVKPIVLCNHVISVNILPFVYEVCLCFSRAFFLNYSQMSEILDSTGKKIFSWSHNNPSSIKTTEAGTYCGMCDLRV